MRKVVRPEFEIKSCILRSSLIKLRNTAFSSIFNVRFGLFYITSDIFPSLRHIFRLNTKTSDVMCCSARNKARFVSDRWRNIASPGPDLSL